MLKKLKKEYLNENVVEMINTIIISDVENEIENIIDEIRYEYEYDEIEIDDDEIIELFDLRNKIKKYLNDELYYENNEIKGIYLDDIINLINNYSNYYLIIENNNESFKNYFNEKIDVDNFNKYNSNDSLILYRSYLENFITINYHEIDDYFIINDIINYIFDEIL